MVRSDEMIEDEGPEDELGVGDGVAVGDGDTVGEGEGEGLGDEDGVGEDVGVGDGVALGIGLGAGPRAVELVRVCTGAELPMPLQAHRVAAIKAQPIFDKSRISAPTAVRLVFTRASSSGSPRMKSPRIDL